MLKIAVCDDEPIYLRDMEHLLEEYGALHETEIAVKMFALPFDLAEVVEGGDDFDIFLLDIYMPGMTGLELARKIRRFGAESPIVFLTTSKEHALEAFGVGAVGYLVKPFECEAFTKVMDNITIHNSDEHKRHIILKIDGELNNVPVRDIMYSEAQKNYQALHLTDGRTLVARMTVSELFEQLSPSGCFIRCGNAFILNLARIKRLTAKSAIFKNNEELFLPRSSYSEVKSQYYEFYKKR